MPNAAANTEAYPIVTALVAPPGAPVIDTVVNLPVEAVVAPTLILSILPVTPEPIVNTPLPVGLIVMLALAELKFTIPLADNVVNAPVAGVELPMFVLLILPIVAGLMVTDPVPDGLIVTFAFAGLNDIVPVAVKEVNVPALGLVAPITTLLIDPVVAGFTVKLLVTNKFGKFPPVLNESVLVSVSVVIKIPEMPSTVNVLLVASSPIVSWPATCKYVYPFICPLRVKLLLVYLMV